MSPFIRYWAKFELSGPEKKRIASEGAKILYVPNRRAQIKFAPVYLLGLLNSAHLFSAMSAPEGKWWNQLCIMSL